MQKKEFIHMDGLLDEVSQYMEQNTNIDVCTENYDELEVRPTGIHLKKAPHMEAVKTLLTDLENSVNLEADGMEHPAPEIRTN